jgi:hypothetical protein
MMQEWIVALIVMLAAFMVVKRYGPRSLRDAITRGQIRLARRFGLQGLAKRLVEKQNSGCGGCDACADQSVQSKKDGPTKVSVEDLRRTIPR